MSDEPSDEELLNKGRAIADELGPTLMRMHKRVPFGTVRDTAGVAYCHAFRAGRATLQRELYAAWVCIREQEALLTEARARIAALESWQYVAAVDALRQAAMRMPSEFRSVEADRLTSAADWLESQVKAPQPPEPCRGAQTAMMRAAKAKG